MSTIQTDPVVTLFGDYSCSPPSYDEVFTPSGELRPSWRKFAEAAANLSREEFNIRWVQAQRLLRQNSLAYPDPANPDARKHPWALDAFPLAIHGNEWAQLEAALQQRAKLLDLVLRDLFGEQTLLQQGIIPPEVLFRHPGYLLPYCSELALSGRRLHSYAADLARSPNGQWWVLADRCEGPSGAGFALENRIAISRMLPDVLRHCHVQRLAPYFIALQRWLAGLSPRKGFEPRIVILSRDAGSANYFEDAFLARYLGFTLAEAGDLVVREQKVHIKTLAGLSRVDVLWRRPNSDQCDPLELPGTSSFGVAGLLQAVRAGNVAVVNGLGSGLVESPVFLAFLPRLSEVLLGEPLKMPNVATWWCGDETARRFVLEHLSQLIIKPAYRKRGVGQADAQRLSRMKEKELRALIEADPGAYIAQESVIRSTAPVWSDSGTEHAFIALRAFAIAGPKEFVVMPGGLARVSTSQVPLELSLLAGEGSKDTWVLSGLPVPKVTLLSRSDEPIELRRGGVDLPSRAAEHFFWLGRNTVRAEALGKLVRAATLRLTSESETEQVPELAVLLRVLASQGQIEPGFVVEEIKGQLPAIEFSLPAAVFDQQQLGSLRSIVTNVASLASSMRDLMSIDSWRIIHQMDVDFRHRPSTEGLLDVLERTNALLVQLAAFSGYIAESMTRTHAWRFLDLGRRLERAMQTAALVRDTLATAQATDQAVLEALLEICDGLMTYRSRYFSRWQLGPVLDLLFTDETNPRSVLSQLIESAAHVSELPQEIALREKPAEQKLIEALLDEVRQADSQGLASAYYQQDSVPLDGFLKGLNEKIPTLCDVISHKYFFHSGPVQQLAEIKPN